MTSGARDGQWTPQMVCDRLVEAFRAMPYMGIHSPRKDVLIPTAGEIDGTKLDIVALTSRYIPRPDDPAHIRVHLLAWARAKAGIGKSISRTCKCFGWSRQTLNENRRKACQIVSEGLNRDGVPIPT
jgi:hypothetical protein